MQRGWKSLSNIEVFYKEPFKVCNRREKTYSNNEVVKVNIHSNPGQLGNASKCHSYKVFRKLFT